MSNNKTYNLEERTFEFARDCRLFVSKLIKTISNIEDAKQLVRSSGSVGANYIEANEKLGDKDFRFRLKTSRKEAKESRSWLALVDMINNQVLIKTQKELIQEATELMKIFGSIIEKGK